MLADIDRPDFDETSLKDVRYALLDTATEALLGEYAQIQGVIGDTVIVHDMTAMGDNSRLLLFDANDGHLIRSIRHIGQGPGEYRWIRGVVTIPERSEIILLSDKAHRYTTDDRYIESYSMSSKHGGALPIGSAERGIHETDAFDGDLHIYQYDTGGKTMCRWEGVSWGWVIGLEVRELGAGLWRAVEKRNVLQV